MQKNEIKMRDMQINQSLEGKKVKITYGNGDIIIGVVTDYVFAEDNEPEGESIIVDDGSHLIEFRKNEIKFLEII